jgi:tetratricopeptide (TPR) repeat protein
VKARWEDVKRWFDVPYCLDKAQQALKAGGTENLEWAGHLVNLAYVANPDNLTANYVRARIRRNLGEIPEAIAILEEIRLNKPQKFATGDDEVSWFNAHRMLGDLYLDSKPDQAILCFQEFTKHGSLSGADTLFKLGKAHENLGDLARAARYYEQVVAYEQHPLYYEARDALDRIRGMGGLGPAA